MFAPDSQAWLRNQLLDGHWYSQFPIIKQKFKAIVNYVYLLNSQYTW